MSHERLILFVTLTFFVSASPGPLMLLCMADGGRSGYRKTLFTMFGASAGNLLLMVLSAAGIGLLLRQTTDMFPVFQWLGAAYVVYLGVGTALCRESRINPRSGHNHRRELWVTGFLVAVSNPKGLIYFAALFPQFIDTAQPLLPQYTVLAVIFLMTDLVWMSIYAVGGSTVMRWMKSTWHYRAFNITSGALLAMAGVLLLVSDLSG